MAPALPPLLWTALIDNALLFGVELAGGLHAGSVSMLANAGVAALL